jgi:hypothetical protein
MSTRSELSPGFVVEELDDGDTERIEVSTQELDVDDPYTTQLAQRVHSVIRSAWWECPISTRDVAGVIAETLFQIGKDIRAGREIEVEHLGRFHRMGMQNPWVIYRAAPALLEPAGELPSYLRRQAE